MTFTLNIDLKATNNTLVFQPCARVMNSERHRFYSPLDNNINYCYNNIEITIWMWYYINNMI